MLGQSLIYTTFPTAKLKNPTRDRYQVLSDRECRATFLEDIVLQSD